ncbi:MAG: hypothetical protein R3C03_08440 [Pirellulaceae bacterium]
MKKIISRFLLAASFALGMAAAARANHTSELPLEVLGEQLTCQADDLQDAFRDQFRKSSLYSELRCAAVDLENAGRVIRRKADNSNGLCRITDELNDANCRIAELQRLVADARYRASVGIDPALCGCTMHIDQKLASIQNILLLMRAEVTAMTVYRPQLPVGREVFHCGGGRVYSDQRSHDDRHAPSFAPPGVGYRGYSSPRHFDIGRDSGIALSSQGLSFRVGNATFQVNR